jgi:hypothetical protein
MSPVEAFWLFVTAAVVVGLAFAAVEGRRRRR